MATRWNDKTNLLAFLCAIAFVLLAVASSNNWFNLRTEQRAGFFSDGIVNSPPTSGYCSQKRDEMLAEYYDSFRKLAGKNIFAFVSNTEWNSKLGVDRGSLLLRDFSYASFFDTESEMIQYTFNATGEGSTYPADCYCKNVVQGVWPYSYVNTNKRYTEMPFIRRPLGFKGPTQNLECCSARDDNGVVRGQVFDKTDPTNICCPKGKVIKRCTDTGACPATRSDIPNVTFDTIRNTDNCCPANRLSADSIAFLKELGEYCKPNVSTTASGCHAFGSDHYGGCAVDISSGVTKSCLKKAGYTIGGYTEGSCVLETESDGGTHYHCTLCNSGGPGTIGYDQDGNY